MKKLLILLVFSVILILPFEPANAQISYCKDFLEGGNSGGWSSSLKTFEDEWDISVGQEVDLDIWINDFPESLITCGFWLVYDPTTISVVDVIVYEVDSLDAQGPWDAAFTTIIPDATGPGTLAVVCGNFDTVEPDSDGDILIAKVRIRFEASGNTPITISTIANFDTVVGDSGWNYDPDIFPNTISVQQECTIDEDCDDGITCTDNTCIAGSCTYTPNDANCPDDGLYCNGTEFCDAILDCSSTGDPCAPDLCDDDLNDCVDCTVDEDCDDGITCTDNTCVAGSCTYTPNDANCPDDGLYCNGTEFCDAILDCSSTGDPCAPDLCDDDLNDCVDCTVDEDCDDGITCTDNTCIAGSCTYTPNDANCPDDGLYCNGTEFCDAILDCSSTGDPCAPDLCDDDLNDCVDCTVDEDCDDGITCTDNTCVAGSCTYTPNDANCPDDGLYCNGTEFCDAILDCSSTGDPCAPDLCDDDLNDCVDCTVDEDCDDGITCTDNTCVAGSCTYTPNDANCPDDGLYCNGTEFCDAILDCSSTGDPCAGGTDCNESTDSCEIITTTTTSINITTSIPVQTCLVLITPDTETVESEDTVSFSAITNCNGVQVTATYLWEILPASTIGSDIDEETGLYTAGNNDTTANVTDTIQVTDLTYDFTDSAHVVVLSETPRACETIIEPATATVSSEGTMTFTATTGGEDCIDPDYEWQIDSNIDSAITPDGATALYQAGSNTTNALQSDTITVVDTANETTAEATVTVSYGTIALVFPRVLFRSRWLPIPRIMFIVGNNTAFNATSQPSFSPDGHITTIGKFAFGSFMTVLVLVSSEVYGEVIDLTVTTTNKEGNEVIVTKEDVTSIVLLPFNLDEQEFKP